MSHASIEYNKAGNAVAFNGDAVQIYRAALCASSLKLFLATGIKPTRGVGLKQLLAIATEYTGNAYHGRKDGTRAIAELTAWVHVAKLSVEEITR